MRIREVAARAWIDATCDSDMRECREQKYYRSLRPLSLEKLCYRYVFRVYRMELEQRIREGKAQRPGSVYDPNLDDGRGAHGTLPVERFGKWAA